MNCQWGDRLRTASDPWTCDMPATQRVTVHAPLGNPIPSLTLEVCDGHAAHAQENAVEAGGRVEVEA